MIFWTGQSSLLRPSFSSRRFFNEFYSILSVDIHKLYLFWIQSDNDWARRQTSEILLPLICTQAYKNQRQKLFGTSCYLIVDLRRPELRIASQDARRVCCFHWIWQIYFLLSIFFFCCCCANLSLTLLIISSMSSILYMKRSLHRFACIRSFFKYFTACCRQ